MYVKVKSIIMVFISRSQIYSSGLLTIKLVFLFYPDFKILKYFDILIKAQFVKFVGFHIKREA